MHLQEAQSLFGVSHVVSGLALSAGSDDRLPTTGRGQPFADPETARFSTAEKLLAAAQMEAELIRYEAREDGYLEGLASGQTAARELLEERVSAEVAVQVQGQLTLLEQTIKSLSELQDQLTLQWETSTIRLSLAIARRIVRRELIAVPEIPRELIAEALQLATGAAAITLRLNPEDVAAVEALDLGEWQRLCGGATPVQVIADFQIARGGCQVNTGDGLIDGQIETQLNRIESELWGQG